MVEEGYNGVFELILNAGNAKSQALLAIESAREGDINRAKKLLKEANSELKLAHKMQFKLIEQEANGKSVDVNILLVHAQDHLTMGIMAKDFAEEFVELYSKLNFLINQNVMGE